MVYRYQMRRYEIQQHMLLKYTPKWYFQYTLYTSHLALILLLKSREQNMCHMCHQRRFDNQYYT